jgi:putative OmpL-like beta-barrel porin-2
MKDKTKVIKKRCLQIIAAIIFILPFKSMAQTATKEVNSLEISGSADVYYTYDFSGKDNIPTSFADDRNSISIGMLDVALTKSFKNVSFMGEFSFGPRSFKSIPLFDPDGDGSGPQIGIQNLSISYALTEKLSLTAGYMGTFVGYELISPAGNFNYSTSYLFSAGPFQNAGFKANYSFSDRLSLMVGLFNDWNVYSDANGISDVGAQLFIAPTSGWDIYLNFVMGPESGTILDLTTGYQITEAFYLGLNAADYTYANKNDGGYNGLALYPQFALNDIFSIGLRTEYFILKEAKDETGAITQASGDVFSTTVTGNFKVGGFTFIPELRLDSSSDLNFMNKESNSVNSASQITFAAVYSF